MSTATQLITEYLGNGGLFNPEMMEHDKVRDLLMRCRGDLQELESIRDYLWPNQTGLPNEHRSALVAIKARERLRQKQIDAFRWINVAERYPTQEDSDPRNGVVLARNSYVVSTVVYHQLDHYGYSEWMSLKTVGRAICAIPVSDDAAMGDLRREP